MLQEGRLATGCSHCTVLVFVQNGLESLAQGHNACSSTSNHASLVVKFGICNIESPWEAAG